jgi:membrane protein implicated in regulation of membrane protease activity
MILPKIAGFAIIAGVAVLVLSILLKLLIGALFIAFAVFAVRSVIHSVRYVQGFPRQTIPLDQYERPQAIQEVNPMWSNNYSNLPIIPIK